MTPNRPLVAVIGTTGVGKSQLAISLAQVLASRSFPSSSPAPSSPAPSPPAPSSLSISSPSSSSPSPSSTSPSPSSSAVDANPSISPHQRSAVILSADSMQLYKGLDVITNKVRSEEMGGVEHWGLDLVTPGEERSWEVGKWCIEADKKVGPLPPPTHKRRLQLSPSTKLADKVMCTL